MIIEIALGIVLAVLILIFFDIILAGALWLIVVAISIAILIGVIALAYYLWTTNPIVLALLFLFGITFYTIISILAQREVAKKAQAKLNEPVDGQSQN